MKIICNKNDLMNGLNIVLKAVSNKSTMSILQCVLFDCTRGDIRLITNDTELGIETDIKSKKDFKDKVDNLLNRITQN